MFLYMYSYAYYYVKWPFNKYFIWNYAQFRGIKELNKIF